MGQDITDIDGIPQFGVNPRSSENLIDAGIQLATEGKYDEALHVTEVCIAMEPWNVVAINNKADILRALGRLQEARDTLMWALTIDPKLAIGWCTLGELLVLAGERFSARLAFEHALTCAGSNSKYQQTIYTHYQALNELEGKQASS